MAGRRVVVVSGHMVDAPDRAAPRFPPEVVPEATRALRAQLIDLGLGPGDLLITAGARGADLLGAELAQDLGAAVWLVTAGEPDAFVDASVELPGSDWPSRFRSVAAEAEVRAGPADFAANNEHLIDVAVDAARPAAPHLVVLWDGSTGDGPGGTADMVDRARALDLDVRIVPVPPPV